MTPARELPEVLGIGLIDSKPLPRYWSRTARFDRILNDVDVNGRSPREGQGAKVGSDRRIVLRRDKGLREA